MGNSIRTLSLQWLLSRHYRPAAPLIAHKAPTTNTWVAKKAIYHKSWPAIVRAHVSLINCAPRGIGPGVKGVGRPSAPVAVPGLGGREGSRGGRPRVIPTKARGATKDPGRMLAPTFTIFPVTNRPTCPLICYIASQTRNPCRGSWNGSRTQN